MTIDSDTEVDPDGRDGDRPAFEDPRLGAVTGDVGVTNERRNILTRLIGMRYWVAFNQERAAQSRFRSVLCCSGPLAGYRRDGAHQRLGALRDPVVSGRHLHVRRRPPPHEPRPRDGPRHRGFLPFAHAITYAPEDLSSYLRQQLRWNKSFYRELLWTVPFLLRCSPYLVFEVLVQTVLPLLLTLAIFSAFALGVVDDPHRLLHYAEVVVFMAALRSATRSTGRSDSLS